MELTGFSTLTFDCYGTLIDWESGILAVLRPWAAKHGIDADDDTLLESFGRHETRVQQATPAMLYPDVLRQTMRAIGAEFGHDAWADEADALGNSVKDWPAFPDCVEALAYLKQNYKLVVLSNIDNESFAHSNRRLGVEFDAVVSAEDVGSYKPNPDNFTALIARLSGMGVKPGDVLHTAQSLYHDIAPARDIGLKTCWINRRHGKFGTGATPPTAAWPDMEKRSMADLVRAHRLEAQVKG
jgi:2-haloacid dehalogenase/putative hydrolase of the HAD superfamily